MPKTTEKEAVVQVPKAYSKVYLNMRTNQISEKPMGQDGDVVVVYGFKFAKTLVIKKNLSLESVEVAVA